VNRRTHRSRLALIVAASVLLAAFATLSFGRRISQRAPWVGVEWVETGLGVTAITVDPKSPAAEGGLLPGDVLVSVGGRSAVSVLSAADAAWRVPHGAAVALTVKRAGVERQMSLLPVRRHAAPTLYGYLVLIGTACFASGLPHATLRASKSRDPGCVPRLPPASAASQRAHRTLRPARSSACWADRSTRRMPPTS